MAPTLRWTALAALFAIPFLPLFVTNGLLFPFISSKGFAFRILVEIAFVAWAALALVDKAYRPRFSWVLVLYAVFTAWMFLADLFGANPAKAFWSNYERMDGWVTMIHAFLFFVVAGSVLSVGKLWKRWWLTALGASTLVAVYGLLQLGGALDIHQGGVRLDATFGNAAYLAAYLLTMIAVALWQALEAAPKSFTRYALVALAVVNSYLLYMTATRGAILAFVISAFLVAGYYAFRSKAGKKIGSSALVVLVLAAGAFFTFKDAPAVRENPVLGRFASLSLEDGTTRFTLWDMAVKGVMERPVFGWGQEGFNYVFAKFYSPELFAQEPWFDRAHSVYMDWFVAGGFPGLLLFLALLIMGVVTLQRIPSVPERIFLSAAVIAYAVQAVFVFDNLLTYVFLAALLATAHTLRAKPVHALEHVGQAQAAVVAPVALVCALAFVWVVNAPGIAGAQELIKGLASPTPADAFAHLQASAASGTFGMQEVSEQTLVFASQLAQRNDVPLADRQQILSFALKQMQNQVAQVPNDPRVRLEFASGLESAGLFKEALSEEDAALALSPKKQLTLLQRAVTKWRSNDIAGAQADFAAAYELDTSFDEVAGYKAAGFYIAGDVAGARSFLQERYGTTTVDHDFLRAVFYTTQRFNDLVLSSELHARNASNDPMALYALAQAYALAGRMNDARTTLQQMIAKYPDTATMATQMLNSLPK